MNIIAKQVNPTRVLIVAIMVALFVLGGLLGQRFGESLVRTEMGDRRSDMQVVGWCVKSNLEGHQANGANRMELIALLPDVTEYCTASWADFKVWVDAEIRNNARKEQENESGNW
jgi:hypothetical protein